MYRAGVVGASGYAGGELLRIITTHNSLALVCATSSNYVGESISNLFPNLQNIKQTFIRIDDVDFSKLDVLFVALPHGESSKFLKDVPDEVLVIDLGADFRLTNPNDWNTFYSGEYAGSWTYGLADVPSNFDSITNSTRVANPGCYATAINLALAPFVADNRIDASKINIVAVSGTSGAGRKAEARLLTSENMNSISPYKIAGTHQHIPEIEQFLNSIGTEKVLINFTPLLAPMPRGILAVIQAPNKNMIYEEALDLIKDFYQDNSFIHLLAAGKLPNTKAVCGTNDVHLQVSIDKRSDQIILTVAIDNLVKGAAGQAIQNFNLMTKLDVREGLNATGVYP